jgi:hypothetical protein
VVPLGGLSQLEYLVSMVSWAAGVGVRGGEEVLGMVVTVVEVEMVGVLVGRVVVVVVVVSVAVRVVVGGVVVGLVRVGGVREWVGVQGGGLG